MPSLIVYLNGIRSNTDCFDLGKTPRATQVPFSDEDQECEGPNQTTCAWTWKRL